MSNPYLRQALEYYASQDSHSFILKKIKEILSVPNPNLTEQDIKRELECSVNYSEFENPVTIPCGHTFEESVVKQLIPQRQARFAFSRSRQESPRCPHCREPFPSQEYPIDKNIQNLVKVLSSSVYAIARKSTKGKTRRVTVKVAKHEKKDKSALLQKMISVIERMLADASRNPNRYAVSMHLTGPIPTQEEALRIIKEDHPEWFIASDSRTRYYLDDKGKERSIEYSDFLPKVLIGVKKRSRENPVEFYDAPRQTQYPAAPPYQGPPPSAFQQRHVFLPPIVPLYASTQSQSECPEPSAPPLSVRGGSRGLS